MGSKPGREMAPMGQAGFMNARLGSGSPFGDDPTGLAAAAAASAGFGQFLPPAPQMMPFQLQHLAAAQMPMQMQPMPLNMAPLQLPTPPSPHQDWAAHFAAPTPLAQPLVQPPPPTPPPAVQPMYFMQPTPTPPTPPPPPSATMTPPPMTVEAQTMSTQHTPLQPHYTHNLSTMSYTPSVWPPPAAPPTPLGSYPQAPTPPLGAASASTHTMKPKYKVINYPPIPIRY